MGSIKRFMQAFADSFWEQIGLSIDESTRRIDKLAAVNIDAATLAAFSEDGLTLAEAKEMFPYVEFNEIQHKGRIAYRANTPGRGIVGQDLYLICARISSEYARYERTPQRKRQAMYYETPLKVDDFLD